MVQEESSSFTTPPPYPWLGDLKPEERGLYLIHLLLSCANHVASENLDNANLALDHISRLASPTGDTMQRMAGYFAEAFADRLLRAWQPGLHKAFNCTGNVDVGFGSDMVGVRRVFFEVMPFLKVAYLTTNQAIVEAVEGEKMVHVVDLCAGEPAQWVSLLRALSAQPQGPPHLRITGIHEKKEVLDQMGAQLTKEAEKLDIPFQFHPIATNLAQLDLDDLRVKTGEALVITSVLQLHSLSAFDDVSNSHNTGDMGYRNYLQSVFPMKPRKLEDFFNLNEDTTSSSTSSTSLSPKCASNLSKLDVFLKSLRGLSPKLVVITEQEANHSGSSLMERVMEALNFYAALFDCLESMLCRASIERQKLEKMMFGEEVKNIIACEGAERKARHEKLGKWVARFELAGFKRVTLSCHGFLLARRFLHSNGYEGFNIKEHHGCLVMCWQERPLYSVSAWRF